MPLEGWLGMVHHASAPASGRYDLTRGKAHDRHKNRREGWSASRSSASFRWPITANSKTTYCITWNSKGGVYLLMDLRDMLNYTLDVVWEEIRFANRHRL
jgi:hypothetical protein